MLTPIYEGLIEETFFNTDVQTNTVVYASAPTNSWSPDMNPMRVPDPDPGESIEQMTRQIVGTPTSLSNAQADMSGFLLDYAALAEPTAAAQIMQSYSPQQVPVISGLTKSFAVCDHWYASVSCQTWPTRGQRRRIPHKICHSRGAPEAAPISTTSQVRSAAGGAARAGGGPVLTGRAREWSEEYDGRR